MTEKFDFTKRPLVYVAGPYSHPDPVLNTSETIRVSGELIDAGLVTPVVPHLTLLWHIVDPRPLEFWYEYDLAILARCDALLRLPGESSGADKEVTYAQSVDIPVFDTVEDLHRWVGTRS